MNDKTMLAAYNLLDAVTALSEIIDVPKDANGNVKVQWNHATELIVSAQLCARSVIDKIHILMGD